LDDGQPKRLDMPSEASDVNLLPFCYRITSSLTGYTGTSTGDLLERVAFA